MKGGRSADCAARGPENERDQMDLYGLSDLGDDR